ncbi:MAG: roadblock/LC7 domain-containing protein [Gemmatimonadaceae bacterium]|nr:roadblock/LC7 domain-containing protein [Gemmatimonadaceae bacterium]
MGGGVMATTPFAPLLQSIIRHRGVTGVLLVGEDDGLVVDSVLQVGVNGAAFAALTASLYRKARRSAEAAGLGRTGYFELDAVDGRVLAAGKNELVFIVVAEARINVGLLRVELLKAVERLP